MYRPRKPLLVLLVLALLLAGAPAASPASRAASPTVYRGTITYMERGPAASPYGLGTTLLMAAAMPIAMARVLNLVRHSIDLITQLPVLKDNPAVNSSALQTAQEWMDEGIPVDLAKEFPIAGAYDATIRFTLAEGDDGGFHLQSGTVEWKTSNALQLAAEGAELHDSFSGSGTYTLDPAKDKIDLLVDHRTNPPTFHLDVEIRHPEPVDGDSAWRGPDGTFEITMEANHGEITMDGSALGMPLSAGGMPSPMVIQEAGDPQERLIECGRVAPLDKLNYDVETWRDTFDNQIVVEYEMDTDCRTEIVEPPAGAMLAYDTSSEGVLEATARAETKPNAAQDALDQLVWTLPELPGSTLTVDPEGKDGGEITFRYQGLPAKNSDFGEKTLRAAYGAGAACADPQSEPVRFFFAREGKNNPDGTVPNWFYYWKQTRAGQGHGDAILYDPSNEDGHTAGYFDGYANPSDARHIHICDLGPSFSNVNPITGKETEGIDVFGEVVLHEWTHLENYWDWWGAKGYDAKKDADGDYVPDAREAGYGLDPRVSDTFGVGFLDVEIPAYLQGNTWINGSANDQDWANPGKQSGGF